MSEYQIESFICQNSNNPSGEEQQKQQEVTLNLSLGGKKGQKARDIGKRIGGKLGR